MKNTRLRVGLSYLSVFAMAILACLPMQNAIVATLVFGLLGCILILEMKFNVPSLSGTGKTALGFALLCLIWGMVVAPFSPHPSISIPYMLNLFSLSMAGLAMGLRVDTLFCKKHILFGAIALSAILVYSLVRFSTFNKVGSSPFFQDTNLLSAAAALLLPGLGAIGWSDRRKWTGWSAWGMVLLFIVAVAVFRSRGAWLSLIAVGLIFPVFLMSKKMLRIGWIIGAILICVTYFTFRTTLAATTYVSRDAIGQLKSIGELKNDFSNRERLMRWECAWRMAIDQPILGQGPGCYPSTFKNFLRSPEEMERISYWFGWRFGAHSDSLNLLAETGFVGFFAFIGMLFATGVLAIRRILNVEQGFTVKAGVMLGLLTWVVHGCFNDLLSSSFLVVWGFWMIGYQLRTDDEHITPSK